MPKRRLERDIAALTVLHEPTRRALYEHVVRQPHAVSREEAATALGINRPLAAFHLDRLLEVGLLTTEYRRLSGRTGPGAGRPAKLYRRSRHRVMVSLPPRDPELLASLLAASIERGDTAAGSAAHEVGRSLGSRARNRMRAGRTAARRLLRVEDILAELGFEPYRRSEREIRLRNCPFDPLSRRFMPIVCGAGLALVEGIVAGVAAGDVTVTRNERPGQCCVVLTAARGDRRGDRARSA